jgi:hypothetical protein
MPLQRPTDEDKRKLHSEINQIANQRFLLSTLAVTAFGVMTTWAMRESPTPGSDLGWLRYLASIILLVVLFGLFYLMHRLRATLLIISSYLIKTKSSGWEMDLKRYREEAYASYTKAHTSLFLVLGILAISIPFTIAFAYHLSFVPSFGAIAVALIGGMYIIFLCGMGFGKWFDSESQIKQRWEKLDK